MNRRTLLKLTTLNAMFLPSLIFSRDVKTKSHKKLILIELKGANDGLNTVVPYNNPIYYQLRPNIAIPKDKVVQLNNKIGLHPSLKKIKEIFDTGELAIIQGVGYANPNRSHFRSIEIWDTASESNEYLDKGWFSTINLDTEHSINGVVLGGEIGPLSGMPSVIKIGNITKFLNQSKEIMNNIPLYGQNPVLNHVLKTEGGLYKSAEELGKYIQDEKKISFKFKKSNFGKQLNVCSQLINAGVDTPYYKLSLGSFDTHINQKRKHSNLLNELSEGISVLRKNLIESGEWENTIIMTYSEFGRRVAENASKGTDHGTAAPHFIIGGKVKGGIYGEHPSLSSLDTNNDLKHTIDFKSVYKSVVKGWFNTSSSHLKQFSLIPLIKTTST